MPDIKKVSARQKRRGAPANTIDGRENQLISMAIDLAERQLLEGTASAQVITHYLKLGTSLSRLEKEKLVEENKLLRAKSEALQGQKKTEDLYRNALKAMQAYSGKSQETTEPDDYET